MRELGVIGHEQFKVTALLDHLAMISVVSDKYGGLIDCKPLAFIWQHAAFAAAGYGPHNTIMFDDLRRNFVMNPQNGLKIRPFRNAHQARRAHRLLLPQPPAQRCRASSARPCPPSRGTPGRLTTSCCG